ncbi:hypothetical protein BD309DRAFT_877987, partial [Dichomitus squalens]
PNCQLRRHTEGVQQGTGPAVQISLSSVALPDRDLQVFRSLRRAASKTVAISARRYRETQRSVL